MRFSRQSHPCASSQILINQNNLNIVALFLLIIGYFFILSFYSLYGYSLFHYSIFEYLKEMI